MCAVAALRLGRNVIVLYEKSVRACTIARSATGGSGKPFTVERATAEPHAEYAYGRIVRRSAQCWHNNISTRHLPLPLILTVNEIYQISDCLDRALSKRFSLCSGDGPPADPPARPRPIGAFYSPFSFGVSFCGLRCKGMYFPANMQIPSGICSRLLRKKACASGWGACFWGGESAVQRAMSAMLNLASRARGSFLPSRRSKKKSRRVLSSRTTGLPAASVPRS